MPEVKQALQRDANEQKQANKNLQETNINQQRVDTDIYSTNRFSQEV